MKQFKIKVLIASSDTMNDSGEYVQEFLDEDKYVVGVVSPVGSSRLVSSGDYTVERTSNTEAITIYSTQLYPWLKEDDRLVYDGKTYFIDGSPLVWHNSRGYKNLTVITATYVEG